MWVSRVIKLGILYGTLNFVHFEVSSVKYSDNLSSENFDVMLTTYMLHLLHNNHDLKFSRPNLLYSRKVCGLHCGLSKTFVFYFRTFNKWLMKSTTLKDKILLICLEANALPTYNNKSFSIQTSIKLIWVKRKPCLFAAVYRCHLFLHLYSRLLFQYSNFNENGQVQLNWKRLQLGFPYFTCTISSWNTTIKESNWIIMI